MCANQRGVGAFDPEMEALHTAETLNHEGTLSLIASENYPSAHVCAMEGSIFSVKNASGYPGDRSAQGCEFVDAVERLATRRACVLFGAEHANVQAMNATIANIAVMRACLEPGDTILSMNPNHGGHRSHGGGGHYSGMTYHAVHYDVDARTETIDLNVVHDLASRYHPRLIVCGGAAYPRFIDFAAMGEIAKANDALLLADVAHISGLIAAGVHESPIPYADFVTTSTHKSLRGPRGGGLILCRSEWREAVDKAVHPGLQSAPKMDMIAARAVLFKECASAEFKEYGKQVIRNSSVLADCLMQHNLRLVTGGTDNHMVVVDLGDSGLDAHVAASALASVGLMSSVVWVPRDSSRGSGPSGVRLGTPAVTTRGLLEEQIRQVSRWIALVIERHDDAETLAVIRMSVKEMASAYPLFAQKWLPSNRDNSQPY